MVLADPRITYTFWTEHNWLYSKHRVPEQSAITEIKNRFLEVLGSENGLVFIPVISSIKDPGILDDELKKLLSK